MSDIHKYRYFLKDSIRKELDFSTTDQSKGVPVPPFEKPIDPGAERINLSKVKEWCGRVNNIGLVEAMARRESRREFSDSPLSLDELAFLLWATQGVKGIHPGVCALRTVPSAGARHCFETYLFVFNVDGLKPGIFRFLPLENQLAVVQRPPGLKEKLIEACFNQNFVGRGAVTFAWTAIPYRMEWRYSLAAHRVILIDSGHVCQNLYLSCEAIGAGTCAVAAYDQEGMDRLLGVDGEDEFCLYLAPVGKLFAEMG